MVTYICYWIIIVDIIYYPLIFNKKLIFLLDRKKILSESVY